MIVRRIAISLFVGLLALYLASMAYLISESSKNPQPKFANPTEIANISVPKAEAKTIEKKTTKKKKAKKKKSKKTKAKYSASYFKRMGVIKWNGRKWTWYSQKVLPGGGLKIKGRHIDSNGYICDWKDRIVLASNGIKKGTVMKTPFGKKGIILDDGCPWMDVYVDW